MNKKIVNPVNKFYPSVSLLLAGLGYALYGPLSRIVGHDFGPVGQTLIRSVIRFLIIIPLILLTRQKFKKIDRSDYRWFILLAAAATGTTLFYIPAIIKLPFGLTMFLFYALGTISSYLCGYLFFGEKLNRGKVLALFFAIAGLFAMFADSIKMITNIYVIFACISGFFFGLFSPSSKKISSKYSLTQVIFYSIIIEFFMYLAAWLVFRDNINVASLGPWIANVIYGIDVVVIAYLVFYGFRHIEVQTGSIIMLSELLFILIIGFLFYREMPTLSQTMGGLLIMSGMIVPQFIKN